MTSLPLKHWKHLSHNSAITDNLYNTPPVIESPSSCSVTLINIILVIHNIGLLKDQVACALLRPWITQTLWGKRRGEITFGVLLEVSVIYFTALLQIKHRISVMGWLYVPVTGLQERGTGGRVAVWNRNLGWKWILRADVPPSCVSEGLL